MPKQSPFWLYVLELKDLHRVSRDVAQKASDRLWPQMDEQSRFYYRQAVAPGFAEKAKLRHTAARRARLAAPAFGSAEYAEKLIIECAKNERTISELEQEIQSLQVMLRDSPKEIPEEPMADSTRSVSSNPLDTTPEYQEAEPYSPSIQTGEDDPPLSAEARQLELAETEIRILEQKIHDLRAESEAQQRPHARDEENRYDGRKVYQSKISRLENELRETNASKFSCDHANHTEKHETLNKRQSDDNYGVREAVLDLLNENYELKTQLLKTTIELKRAQSLDWPDSSSSSHGGSS